jgi:hypothetical protein
MEQSFDPPPQFGVSRARLLEVGGALVSRQLERSVEHGHLTVGTVAHG